MSSALRGNGADDSKGFAPGPSAPRSVFALRSGLAIAGLAGALLLIAATFATIIQIRVGTSTKAVGTDTSHSGWDRHGPALIVLALLAVCLLVPALRGGRAAMAGLAAAGIAALAIAMVWDRPHVHDTGSVGDIYAEAHADPGPGYYLETLGGALALLSGGALLLLGPVGSAQRERPPRRAAVEES
jgi:hypothetical protein